jgi:hydroxymethylbilane synthase
VQTRQVASLLTEAVGDLEVELVVVETRGDRDRLAPIHAIGGEGVFVKEVEAAVLEGRAEAAVHSAKDLPASKGASAQLLEIVAVPKRADPRDVLVGRGLQDLATGAEVATGSVRRRAQLAWLRPDLVFTELRGNIATRLEKVPAGGAVVMAAAALHRLGLSDQVTQFLSCQQMLPQVGQGAIAVTARREDEETAGLLSQIEDPQSRACLEAERAYLAEIGGGCEAPIGAFAQLGPDGSIRLEAMIASLDGHVLIRQAREGNEPTSLGRALARELLEKSGGTELLDRVGPLSP